MRLKDQTMLPEIETEYLVVGAGPAGASLACFLGQNGEQGSSTKYLERS